MTASYGKPPILEAVIEFTYAELSASLPERAALKFRGFPLVQDDRSLTAAFQLGAERNVQYQEAFVGKRLTSADHRHVLMIRRRTFGYAELAPYSGWDAFSNDGRRHWERLQKTTGRLNVTRIGLRYINRIDVP